ncbi:MAG: hypothetical protein WDM92_07905 [Caulobacteraceae bacterium]
MSLLKAWNGVFMMAVRLMLAMARVGLLPPASRGWTPASPRRGRRCWWWPP